MIEAGHLSGFATDESAAVALAAAGQAGDDTGADFGVERADGEVVEEVERARALDGDVVDTVVDEVFADGVVTARHLGDFEFGADAIGGRDQHRLFVAFEGVHGAEAPDAGEHAGRKGGAGKLLDGAYGAVGFVNVDAGVRVAEAFLR